MEKISKKESFIQIIKFTLFSISAGIIQIASFTLFNEVFHWTFWLANIISITLSVIYNLTLNRKFTFKSASNIPIAMLLVGAYYLVFSPLSSLWGDALTKLGWNEYIVVGMNMIINFVTEFLYQRYFVFRNSINTQKKKNDTVTNEIKL